MSTTKERCETCGTTTLHFDPPIEIEPDREVLSLLDVKDRLDKLAAMEKMLADAEAVGARFLLTHDIRAVLDS